MFTLLHITYQDTHAPFEDNFKAETTQDKQKEHTWSIVKFASWESVSFSESLG